MGIAHNALALFLVCFASAALAQNGQTQAIYQTTFLDFRVTGLTARNFSQPAQDAFSANLQTLLNTFDFFSLRVIDLKVGCPMVDTPSILTGSMLYFI